MLTEKSNKIAHLNISDLSAEDKAHHINEIQYHSEQLKEEVEYHLKRINYHLQHIKFS